MGNSIGNDKIILIKSLCLKIILLLYKNDIRINDLFYALSCLELIDENGKSTRTMQGLNPMLFIKKNIKECLHELELYDLIYVHNHLLSISADGIAIIDKLIESNILLIKEYMLKTEKIDSDYREKYYKLIDERGVLNENK